MLQQEVADVAALDAFDVPCATWGAEDDVFGIVVLDFTQGLQLPLAGDVGVHTLAHLHIDRLLLSHTDKVHLGLPLFPDKDPIAPSQQLYIYQVLQHPRYQLWRISPPGIDKRKVGYIILFTRLQQFFPTIPAPADNCTTSLRRLPASDSSNRQ